MFDATRAEFTDSARQALRIFISLPRETKLQDL